MSSFYNSYARLPIFALGKSLLFAMRQLADIPHPEVKITLFSWNGKYLIKLEKGLLEQTYKVSELDVTSAEDVRTLLDAEFLQAAIARFTAMRADLQATFDRHEL
jgi:hypothetical protein